MFDQPFSDFYSTENNLPVIGNSLKEKKVNFDLLRSIITDGSLTSDFPRFSLSNQIALDLLAAKDVLGATWIDFHKWVVSLCDLDGKVCFDDKLLRHYVLKVKDTAAEMKRHQKLDEMNTYLHQSFVCPKKDSTQGEQECQHESNADADFISAKENARVIECLLSEIEYYKDGLSYLVNEYQKEKNEKREADDNIEMLKKDLKDKVRLLRSTELKLQSTLKKLSHYEIRNINKRIKRVKDQHSELQNENEMQQQMIIELSSQLLEKDNAVRNQALQIEEINKRLDSTLKDKLKLQKQKYYYKSKYEEISGKDSEETISRSKIKELNGRIHELENEKIEIEEKLNVFLNGDEIRLFENGKYVDEVRMLYEDLLCMGVSTRNIEGVIRKVLKYVIDADVGRLPKATFAKYMLLQARSLAQIQVVDELVDGFDSENRTLHSDGTSKKGHSFITFDIVNDAGKTFVAGLREVSSGDAESQLQVLENILEDVCAMFGLQNDGKDQEDKAMNKILKSIKNVMSDRCAVQKRFNNLFTNYRKEILPTVVKEWESLSEEERAKMSKVNEYFCGLHFLVGLADQAEACCKIWDTLCFGDNKVGSLANGGYSKGESGVYRLICTVCKSVQERGCEKSGRMMQFQSFLMNETNVTNIPLALFFGNRFNILFYNAAGTFFLEKHLKVFFERYYKENKLLSAVHDDLQIPSFMAACRALGMIDKLVTGPLWRMIAKEGHILDMNTHYQRLFDCFTSWGNNASEFMTGNIYIFGEEVKLHNDDEIFKSLFEPKGKELDELTRQCLEVIFVGLLQ